MRSKKAFKAFKAKQNQVKGGVKERELKNQCVVARDGNFKQWVSDKYQNN